MQTGVYGYEHSLHWILSVSHSLGVLDSLVQAVTITAIRSEIRGSLLHSSAHMTAPFLVSVSYGFGYLYFVEFGLHGLIISGQSSYGYVLCLVVGQTKLVLGT